MHATRTAPPSPAPPSNAWAGVVLRSGWVPAALVLLLAAWLLREAAGVGLRDQVFYAGYIVGWVVLPGTLGWRLIDRRGARPLVEDLALGSLLGFLLEFPVYLGCLGLGHPRWYLLWPAVVLGLTLGTPRGRELLRRRGPRMSTGWSWSVAGLLGYAIVWFARNVWGPSPAAGPNLRAPYVDEPYHLSLIASLKHFAPPKVLFVDGTPLDYHYLSHVHMAAGSWISGVEPIVVLRALAMPTVAVLVLLALATAAARLSDWTWLGPVALAGILVAPANFSGGSNGLGVGFLDIHLYTSPSAAFTNVGLLLGIVLVIELLRRQNHGIGFWALTGFTMVAMCGGKAASLPTVVGGLFLATIVATLVDRRIAVRPLLLTALGGAAFLVARWLFFGANSQGLSIDPLGVVGLAGRSYPSLLGEDGELSFLVSLVIALSFFSAIALGAGVLAGLGAGGWREPDVVFLVGLCASGYGAALMTHQVGYSEGYFIIAVQIPLILGAALGIGRHRDGLVALASSLGVRGGRLLVLISVAAGLGAGLLYTAINRPISPDDIEGAPLVQAFRLFAMPFFTVLLGGAAVAAAVVTVLRRRAASAEQGASARPAIAICVAVAALVFVGIGVTPTLYRVKDLLADPVPAPVETSPGLIAPGGITAARYLRDKTPLDTMVATNAHCERPHRTECIGRNFWMAGFAERQFLVEGWAYVSRASVGLDAGKAENITSGPFWDPARLAINDAAFVTPSAETLDALRTTYGVRWLLVDRRFPVDVRALRQHADQVFRTGRYLVFAVR